VTVQQPSRADESLGELFSAFTNDLGALVRDEIQLARVEVSEDLSRVGKAGGVLGAAAFAGYVTVLLLSFALAWGLTELVPVGVAFLIVGLLWAAAAGVLFVIGRQRMREANVKPEQTIETMQENMQWVKQQKS
jgi:hypothetical protein